MKYFHRNYFFLLIASALNHSTVVTNVDVYKRQPISALIAKTPHLRPDFKFSFFDRSTSFTAI